MNTVLDKNDLIFGEQLYDFKILNINELMKYPDSLKNIYHRNIDGFLIKNVLSQEQVKLIVESLPKVDSTKKILRREVEIYPRGFAAYFDNAESDPISDLNKYFEDGKNYRQEFVNYFGIDFEAILIDAFRQISGGREVQVSPGFNNHGCFTSSQIRRFYPDQGALPVHCGNVFQHMYQDFYDELSKTARIQNQMSYFVLLQKPQSGGELVLYDILWEEGQQMKPFEEMVLSDGTVINPVTNDSIKKMFINPEPGDMVIFMGGKIWHKVQDVKGTNDRISIGGFFTFSNDDKRVLFWA